MFNSCFHIHQNPAIHTDDNALKAPHLPQRTQHPTVHAASAIAKNHSQRATLHKTLDFLSQESATLAAQSCRNQDPTQSKKRRHASTQSEQTSNQQQAVAQARIQQKLNDLSTKTNKPDPYHFMETMQEIARIAYQSGLKPGHKIKFTPQSIPNAQPVQLVLSDNESLGFQPANRSEPISEFAVVPQGHLGPETHFELQNPTT